ncbi:GNAT family N-acetyltransferase [Pyxidicoccus sp. 3LG]
MPNHSFATYPELVTDRFLMRQPRLEDAAELATIYGDSEVARYIPYDAAGGVQKMLEKLTRDLETASHGEGFRWVVCERGQQSPLGTVGLFNWSQRDRHAEVGYVLARPLWGRGVMKDLMPALLRFGFEQMRLHRIEARVDTRNAASLRVLTRAGFQQEGVLREDYVEPDGFSDTAILSLLEREWRQRGPPEQ